VRTSRHTVYKIQDEKVRYVRDPLVKHIRDHKIQKGTSCAQPGHITHAALFSSEHASFASSNSRAVLHNNAPANSGSFSQCKCEGSTRSEFGRAAVQERVSLKIEVEVGALRRNTSRAKLAMLTKTRRPKGARRKGEQERRGEASVSRHGRAALWIARRKGRRRQ